MAKTAAVVFGIIFVLVGLLGFVTNPLVGMHGLFMTNTLHNLVHLIVGIILLIASRGSTAAMWLKIFGVVYLVLGVLALVLGSSLGLEINGADNWLHIVLGIVLLVAGWRGNSAAMQPAMPMAQ